MVTLSNSVLYQSSEFYSAIQEAVIGQCGYIITGNESYLEAYQSGLTAYENNLENLRTLIEGQNQKQRLAAAETLAAQRIKHLQQGIELRRSNNLEALHGFIESSEVLATKQNMRKALDDIEQGEQDLLKQRDEQAKTTAYYTKLVIVMGALAAIMVLAFAGIAITRNISKPLTALAGASGRVAAGDLELDLPVTNRADEVGVLSHTFRGMVESLRQQTREITEGINSIASSSAEISTSTVQFASSAAETASAVSQSTATVEEVKQTALVSSQKSRSVADTAQKALQASQEGEKAVEETIAQMNRIREQMQSVAESIMRLSEQSQAIGEIVMAVSDLADQSNLLAVNASIEAAHAGEQGKGFAVVAQEIQSLAEQSKQSTAQVRTILGQIQKATSAAVMAIEQGTKAVNMGVQQSMQAGGTICTLTSSVSEAANSAVQIAASSQQQLTGMDQVVGAMGNIKQASAQTAASTRQAETVAQNLNELGQRLKKLVQHYRV